MRQQFPDWEPYTSDDSYIPKVISEKERKLCVLLTEYLYTQICWGCKTDTIGEFDDGHSAHWEWACEYLTEIDIFLYDDYEKIFRARIALKEVKTYIDGFQNFTRRHLYEALTSFVEISSQWPGHMVSATAEDLSFFMIEKPQNEVGNYLIDIFEALLELGYVTFDNGYYKWAHSILTCTEWGSMECKEVRKWVEREYNKMPGVLPFRISKLSNSHHNPSDVITLLWRHWDGVEWKPEEHDKEFDKGRGFRNRVLINALIKRMFT